MTMLTVKKYILPLAFITFITSAIFLLIGPLHKQVHAAPDLGVVKWETVDCTSFQDNSRKKCEAIKICVNSIEKSSEDCKKAYDVCFDAAKNDGATIDGCGNLVKEGKLDEATLQGLSEKGTSCSIDKIGWIICPVFQFLGEVSDAAYTAISKLLTIQPLNIDTTNETNAAYKTWQMVLSIANVAFVIVFLFVIYSQITGVGVSNYGIKKILPRIIVAAILVNISYWICAVAVDLSNIAGVAIHSFFEKMNNDIAFNLAKTDYEFRADGTGGTAFSALALVVTANAIAGATATPVALVTFMPIILSVFLIAATVLVTLAIRQALVIILIVISPLAFVAYLLPNTEDFFKKWRKLLTKLLLMYPVIAFVFGGSSVASGIIVRSSDDLVVKIIGAGVAIVPLFIVPTLMKLGSTLLGGIAGRVNGLGDKSAEKTGIRSAIQDRADLAKKRQLTRFYNGDKMGLLRGFRLRNAGRFEAKKKRIEAEADAAETGWDDDKAGTDYIAARQTETTTAAMKTAISSSHAKNLANMSDKDIEAALGPNATPENIAAMKSQVSQATEASVKDTERTIRLETDPDNLGSLKGELVDSVRGGDSIRSRAIQNILMTSGAPGLDIYRGAMDEIEKEPIEQNSGTERAMTEVKRSLLNEHGGIKASAADLIAHAAAKPKIDEATGNVAPPATRKAIGEDSETWRKLTNEELVRQKPTALTLAAKSGAISISRIDTILSDPRLYNNLSEDSVRVLADTRQDLYRQEAVSYDEALRTGTMRSSGRR